MEPLDLVEFASIRGLGAFFAFNNALIYEKNTLLLQ